MIGGHPIVYVLLSQLFRHFIAFVSLIHGSIESHDVRGHFLKHMAQENTPESNEACMKLLEKARKIATARNLDINKQEILLLMRMNKQAKAADKLKEYLDLLAEYKQQNDMNTQESEWIGEELDWADKMLSKISLL